MNLKIQQLRYEFASQCPLELHQDLPTITLRGAFGYALAQVIARNTGVVELEAQCALFRDLFMPQNDGNADSRNLDLTRPFVMRSFYNRKDRRSLILDVHLFGKAIAHERFFDSVIETMGYMGLGRTLQECRVQKLFSRELHAEIPADEVKPFLEVRFLTPCSKLKFHGKLFHDEIPFYVLLPRLIDRVRELLALYEDGAEMPDEENDGQLKLLSREIPFKKISGGEYSTLRISGRTGDHIRMNGFVGTMVYVGDFTPFLDYLRYLPHINLGRFNVFGCGWCEMRFLSSDTETGMS